MPGAQQPSVGLSLQGAEQHNRSASKPTDQCELIRKLAIITSDSWGCTPESQAPTHYGMGCEGCILDHQDDDLVTCRLLSCTC